MGEKRTLWKAVSSAHRSLFFEHVLIGIQKGLLYAVLSSTLIYFVSRFFVFPYYSYVAFIVAIFLFLGHLIWTIWIGPSRKQALFLLDSFFPHNELVTVLTAKNQTALISQLLIRSGTLINEVLRLFKKRPKNIWQRKIMLSCFVSFLIFIILFVFPAEPQKEAKLIEEEHEITEELKEKIEEQKVEQLPEEVQKKLDELLQAIEESKTSDEIINELVKAQKELTKMEQQLASQEQNKQIESQLAAIQSVTSSLADNTNLAMKRLSEIGKPLDFTMQRTIANMNQNMSNLTASNGSNTSNQQNGNSNQQSNANGQSNGQNSQGQGQAQGQGTGHGQGTGQGQGQGGSQGEGTGQGQDGQGQGQGTGQTGGLYGGVGSGGRELIAVPERIGQAGDSTVDAGTINDGETITEKGPVPTTKGTVHAYGDVIGSYKESYRKSTERLQLPSDLQKKVQSYFTAIE